MKDYTVIEAAALLGIQPRSVRKFIERGRIAATKRAGVYFITAEEVERYKREKLPRGAQRGRKRSDETKRKLSEARKGAKNPFHGKKHKLESRARISAASSQQPRGEASHAWKGGRITDKAGYIQVYMPDHPHAVVLYVLEHRLVMEQVLGRYLTSDEVVHHKNGIKTDNRPENLEVMTQSAHIAYHRSISPTLPRIRKKRGL